jgi:transcription elongation factor GreA
MHDELTQVDIDKMKEEIRYRTSVLDPQLKEMLKTARELGDLSENDEYKTAKRELGKNRGRIRYLENMIATAKIIKTDSKADEVGLFDFVEIYYEEDDEYRTVRIVTTLRNDVLSDCISKESPVGRALLGRKVGDRVTVQVNDRVSYPVVIKSLKKGEDDSSLPISNY